MQHGRFWLEGEARVRVRCRLLIKVSGGHVTLFSSPRARVCESLEMAETTGSSPSLRGLRAQIGEFWLRGSVLIP